MNTDSRLNINESLTRICLLADSAPWTGPAIDTCRYIYLHYHIKLQRIMQYVMCAAVSFNREGSEYLVALFSCAVVPVGIGEVNVTGSVLHDLLNVPAPFPDHVRVLRVWDVHLQRDFIYLCTGGLLWDRHREDEQRNQRSSNLTLVSRSSKILRLASRTFALFPSTFTWGSDQKYTNHHSAFYFHNTKTFSGKHVDWDHENSLYFSQ